MTLLVLIAGLLGGAWHLLLTARRAFVVGSGGLAEVALLTVVAFAGPLLAVGLAVKLAPGSVWAVLPGLILARALFLAPLDRWMATWTR